jgi:DNA (cytosine-5)-methyltransferase 1
VVGSYYVLKGGGKFVKFLDLFAGIGGFRLGMEQAGHECVGYVEWDKYARKSYEAIHDTEGEWTAHDITTVTDADLEYLRGKGIDVICGGFPCQAFSVAGKRGGFDDTRGTLFFEIARFAKQIKPRLLLLENVKGLLSHDQGNTFGTILHTLDELGYDTEWQVLNSKDFRVPQNRERVFIVGHLRGFGRREVFPIGRENKNSISIAGYLGDGYKDVNYVLNPEGIAKCLLTMGGGNREPKVLVKGNVNPSGIGMNGNVFDIDGLSPTITTNKGEGPKVIGHFPTPNGINNTLRTGGKGSLTAKHNYEHIAVLTPDRVEKRQNGRRFKEDGEQIFTLTAQDRHGVAIKEATKKGYDIATVGDSINFSVPNSETRRGRVGKGVANTLDTQCNQATLTTDYRIRKLTPRECWRLQGFPDWAFDKAAEVNSDSQLYKQAGNSVTKNVIFEIAKRLS